MNNCSPKAENKYVIVLSEQTEQGLVRMYFGRNHRWSVNSTNALEFLSVNEAVKFLNTFYLEQTDSLEGIAIVKEP